MTLSEKTVEVEINDILDMANSAWQYGREDMLPFYAAMTGYVSDEQIKLYIDTCLTKESGYSEEDWDSALETLTEWRDKYCTKEEK